MSNDAEHGRAIGYDPAAVVLFAEPDWLAHQRLADIDGGAAPSDLAAVAHPAHVVLVAVLGLPEHAGEAPRRGSIVFMRSGVAERCMRAFLVVDTLESLEAIALPAQAQCWRRGGVLKQ